MTSVADRCHRLIENATASVKDINSKNKSKK